MSDEELQRILDEYQICYVVGSLPSTSRAFTFNYGDKYLIVVSDACSKQQQRKSLLHELSHITGGHFDGTFDEVEDFEKEATSFSNNKQIL